MLVDFDNITQKTLLLKTWHVLPVCTLINCILLILTPSTVCTDSVLQRTLPSRTWQTSRNFAHEWQYGLCLCKFALLTLKLPVQTQITTANSNFHFKCIGLAFVWNQFLIWCIYMKHWTLYVKEAKLKIWCALSTACAQRILVRPSACQSCLRNASLERGQVVRYFCKYSDDGILTNILGTWVDQVLL